MDDQLGSGNLLDTTDSLEAVGVFRGWKNFMFIIVLVSMLVVQGAFWLVNSGTVAPRSGTESGGETIATAPKAADANLATAAAGDPNKPAGAAAGKSGLQKLIPFGITFKTLAKVLTFVNAVLMLAACLYFLTVMFCLKVSLIGKLGGINHISRAFFLSLFMLVLLLPWQNIFGGIVVGAIYSPAELAEGCSAPRADMVEKVLFYLRFSGYWLLILLLLILSQLRTCRWSKAILRRLEVV